MTDMVSKMNGTHLIPGVSSIDGYFRRTETGERGLRAIVLPGNVGDLSGGETDGLSGGSDLEWRT